VATQRLLRASGWTPTFRCWGSRRLDWGIAQIDRARKLGQLPGVVVLAMGTNDISWETPATTTRRVRTLLERIGPTREVLWVDLDVDHSSFSRERAAWFNRFIRAEARMRDNLTVLDWERFARSKRAARYDGIHYGERGYRLRAEFLAQALDSQARRWG
jgi:lysophospholipase L1-like esterase